MSQIQRKLRIFLLFIVLGDGVDPSENRKAQKSAQAERAANSFEVVAREWFAKYSPNWAASHSDRVVFPWIGGRPIAEITAPELLAVVRSPSTSDPKR